ncbi:DedA family protein [Lactobacillus sp.]|uniref:DedA family protein n=1 Tax=Lactobacillus sp. TaxID=1591 RepID=UPI003EF6B22E
MSFIQQLLNQNASLAYALITLMLFVETGLVFMPFLPGDSLLFLSGTVLAQTFSNPVPMMMVFAAAAVLGDLCNYYLGRKFGKHVLDVPFFGKFVKQKDLDRTHNFFIKYGNGAISLGRFVPIIRTLIPFTAGIGEMAPSSFIAFNILGGISWVIVGVLAGYFFGGIAFVRQHFSLIMLAIIVISVLPVVIAYLKNRKGGKVDEQVK